MRWVVKLAEFDLDIQHRKGRKSANVDGITRTPPPPSNTFGETHIECLYDTHSANTDTINMIDKKRNTTSNTIDTSPNTTDMNRHLTVNTINN
jgi:hypothetical protein